MPGLHGLTNPAGLGGIRANVLVLALAALIGSVVGSRPAPAQTFKILHEFTGGPDGGYPIGLTLGHAGELYGAASQGGNRTCDLGCGTIFELSPDGPTWNFRVLRTFQGDPDGAYPRAPMIFGPDSGLYGVTGGGGITGGITAVGQTACEGGCGTVFRLQPSPCETAACPWDETVLYRFPGDIYGAVPGFDAPLIFDQSGNLYGTTQDGGYFGGICNGNYGCGVVFELTPSDGGWDEKVLYTFTGDGGAWPGAGLIFDNAGNLYGTTTWTAFQLTPSGSNWNFNLILETGDTIFGPGLVLDRSGNMYGATEDGGTMGGGNVFKIMRDAITNGWQVQSIYSFVPGGGRGNYYPGPSATITMDAEGNLYGATEGDGYGAGSVFKLSPAGDGDPWSYTYTDLHDFSGPDGLAPVASVVLDADGNLYGTTEWGGSPSCNCGVVFEIIGASTSQKSDEAR